MLLLRSCVTRGKSLNFSGPHAADPSNGCDNFEQHYCSQGTAGWGADTSVPTGVSDPASGRDTEQGGLRSSSPSIPGRQPLVELVGREAFQTWSPLGKVAGKWVGDTPHIFLSHGRLPFLTEPATFPLTVTGPSELTLCFLLALALPLRPAHHALPESLTTFSFPLQRWLRSQKRRGTPGGSRRRYVVSGVSSSR